MIREARNLVMGMSIHRPPLKNSKKDTYGKETEHETSNWHTFDTYLGN